jgi:hypothetical protein
LGCGANLAKQLAAINNTGRKLANISIIHLTEPAAGDSRYQLKHDPDHDHANHAELKQQQQFD